MRYEGENKEKTMTQNKTAGSVRRVFVCGILLVCGLVLTGVDDCENGYLVEQEQAARLARAEQERVARLEQEQARRAEQERAALPKGQTTGNSSGAAAFPGSSTGAAAGSGAGASSGTAADSSRPASAASSQGPAASSGAAASPGSSTGAVAGSGAGTAPVTAPSGSGTSTGAATSSGAGASSGTAADSSRPASAASSQGPAASSGAAASPGSSTGAATSSGTGAAPAAAVPDAGASSEAAASSANTDAIQGKDWKLSELRFSGRTLIVDRNKLRADGMGDFFTLTVDGQRISGKAAPNRYTAPYQAGADNSLRILPPAGTLMASVYDPERIREEEYFQFLIRVKSWKLNQGKLELYTVDTHNNEVILVYVN
jgi:heat shock protein HslJ